MHDNLYMCLSATSNNGVCYAEIGLSISAFYTHWLLAHHVSIVCINTGTCSQWRANTALWKCFHHFFLHWVFKYLTFLFLRHNILSDASLNHWISSKCDYEVFTHTPGNNRGNISYPESWDRNARANASGFLVQPFLYLTLKDQIDVIIHGTITSGWDLRGIHQCFIVVSNYNYKPGEHVPVK